ncbi:MAG: CDGSH iron-sulfur domain-containing protein [Candidatus Pacearchaeota archaeon]|jgi:CDGSH-type Zn-finger protein
MKNEIKITVSKDGPYIVTGKVPLIEKITLVDKNGDPIKWKTGKQLSKRNCTLCRCGHSNNKPFCDSTHLKINFNGKEIENKKYKDMALPTNGPELTLMDAKELCSNAGFCYRVGGTWNLTGNSNYKKSKKLAIQQACDCPSGRLVIYDKKSKKEIEPKFKPTIGIIEIPHKNLSGPIWVMGRIPIVSSNGKEYEIRNRVTLCRCGASKNKPFCDGAHVSIGFLDKKS